jgi:glycosyltransferase involved in cell wall biosynthesis
LKPVLFITGNVPAYRAGALAALHEREGIVVALTGGRSIHGGAAPAAPLPFPSLEPSAGELLSLAAGSGHRAVVCSTSGRLAPLAGWAGARRAGLPLLLWTSLWAHPRTPAHALGYVALRRLYGSADAVVTYGPHVSAYVRARGAHNVYEAPQSVDNDFWQAPARSDSTPVGQGGRFVFVGRPVAEKGLDLLLEAWGLAGGERSGTLTLVGGYETSSPLPAGVRSLERLAPEALREIYAACDVLVIPSLATRTFREPWGLVANEAMNAGLAVIASDAVGAAAGGLVRDGVNGLVVRSGDAQALARAIERLAGDPEARARMGRQGTRDVAAYSHEAWAEGFSRALASVGVSRVRW